MNNVTTHIVEYGNLHIDPLKDFFIRNKPFTTTEVAKALSIDQIEAAKLVYRYKKQQHLLMVKRGLYIPISHKGLTPEEAFSDPWSIVPAMFPTSYIGGWTAANYFGLTEQLFQVTCVITRSKIHHRTPKVGRFEYALFNSHMCTDLGQDTIWRDQIKIPISDVHRTVIDMLEDPKCGAGIQNAVDCFKAYLDQYFDNKVFIQYVQGVNNGVFFKRLGYLVETLLGAGHVLCELAKERITSGYSSIDPNMNCTKLVTRWHLYISESIGI